MKLLSRIFRMGNERSALRPEAISDLEDQTSFSSEEIRNHYKKFMKETGDSKMTLTSDQFVKLYSRIFPNGDAGAFAVHVFRTFDSDGNGEIDFREFMASLSVQNNGSLEDKLNWLFGMYDIDDSGFISKGELNEMVNVSKYQSIFTCKLLLLL